MYKGQPQRHGDGQRRSLHVMVTHCARFASSVLSCAMRCLVWVNRCGFTCACTEAREVSGRM